VATQDELIAFLRNKDEAEVRFLCKMIKGLYKEFKKNK